MLIILEIVDDVGELLQDEIVTNWNNIFKQKYSNCLLQFYVIGKNLVISAPDLAHKILLEVFIQLLLKRERIY